MKAQIFTLKSQQWIILNGLYFYEAQNEIIAL
jgi:hypothetical protein